MEKTLVERSKDVDVDGRKQQASRKQRERKTKLPREEYIEVALAHLRGEISLTQILIAGDYKSNDMNSSYRIVAIGCRWAAEDGRLGEVEEEEGIM